MELFNPKNNITRYIFFTGKGGVGKTSLACSTAAELADNGRTTLLISTDPASNLQDVFGLELSDKFTQIPQIPGLSVANLDPIKAAQDYREKVIAPYRGLMPDDVIANMEEQLSGSCTIEIAAFNQFADFLTNDALNADNIIFDTAPTGHTLRMLQLPSAWSNFISQSTHGASCLGQLSGLEARKSIYSQAVNALADGTRTSLVLVARPEDATLKEAARASRELADLGVRNQILVLNGLLSGHDDEVSSKLFDQQNKAIASMPENLRELHTFFVPLRTYNITGLDNVRAMLNPEQSTENLSVSSEMPPLPEAKTITDIARYIESSNKRVIFTMGKGGVGKTTIAAALALRLSQDGNKILLASTDPAQHLSSVINENENLKIAVINEREELEKYRAEVIAKAKLAGLGENDIAYIEEDLRSPCTQEIAVFRRFAEIVDEADDRIVIIDTAPTGHSLLLLEQTQSYNREIQRTKGETPEAVKKLLPRLKSKAAEFIIVTLPEATPYYEAQRLQQELVRAGLKSNWHVVNKITALSNTSNNILRARALSELFWLEKIKLDAENLAFAGLKTTELKGENLLAL